MFYNSYNRNGSEETTFVPLRSLDGLSAAQYKKQENKDISYETVIEKYQEEIPEIYLLGDQGTGKTTFLNNFLSGNSGKCRVTQTKVQTEFETVDVTLAVFNSGARLLFWDFKGDQLFNEKQVPDYKKADICIFFYDPRRIITLVSLNKFVEDLGKHNCSLVILEIHGDGNPSEKIDGPTMGFVKQKIFSRDRSAKVEFCKTIWNSKNCSTFNSIEEHLLSVWQQKSTVARWKTQQQSLSERDRMEIASINFKIHNRIL